MKKILCISLLSLLVSSTGNAQQFRWAKDIGGAGPEMLLDMTVDASGNIISTGYFAGSVDFDPGAGTKILTSAGSNPDLFVQKMDKNGNLIWAVSLGDQEWDWGDAVKTDAAGNIYIAGRFRGTVDFDPGANTYTLTSQTYQCTDVFMLKLDASGNFGWAVQRQSLGNFETDAGNVALDIDKSNNLYLAYSFRGSSGGYRYMFIEKASATGVKLWSYKVAGDIYADIKDRSLAVDGNGNVIVAGGFDGSIKFDVNGNSVSSFGGTGFILKLDNSGNYGWMRGLWGNGCNAHAVITDAADNIYIGGDFSGIVDFDPGTVYQMDTASSNYPCMYLLKLSPAGNYSWVKTFDGNNFSTIQDLALDAAGNVYATGYFDDQLYFRSDPPVIVKTTVNGTDDIFTMKLDNTGDVQWAKQMGGPNQMDIGYAVALNSNNDVYTGGVFLLSANFNWDGPAFYMNTVGAFDAFVSKFAQCPNLDTAVTMTGPATLKAHATGLTYQWVSCSGGLPNVPVPGAVNQAFTASTNGSYALVVYQGDCSDTSACYVINSVGIADVEYSNTVTVAPNPNNGSFIIKMNPGVHTNVQVTNIYGQQMRTVYEVTGEGIGITLMDAPAGVYFVTISSPAGKHASKIIVR